MSQKIQVPETLPMENPDFSLMRTQPMRKNLGFSKGRVSKTRIFRLNADNLCVIGMSSVKTKKQPSIWLEGISY